MNDNQELIQLNKIIQQLEAKAQRQSDAHGITLRHLEIVRAERADLEKKAAKKAT